MLPSLRQLMLHPGLVTLTKAMKMRMMEWTYPSRLQMATPSMVRLPSGVCGNDSGWLSRPGLASACCVGVILSAAAREHCCSIPIARKSLTTHLEHVRRLRAGKRRSRYTCCKPCVHSW